MLMTVFNWCFSRRRCCFRKKKTTVGYRRIQSSPLPILTHDFLGNLSPPPRGEREHLLLQLLSLSNFRFISFFIIYNGKCSTHRISPSIFSQMNSYLIVYIPHSSMQVMIIFQNHVFDYTCYIHRLRCRYKCIYDTTHSGKCNPLIYSDWGIDWCYYSDTIRIRRINHIGTKW